MGRQRSRLCASRKTLAALSLAASLSAAPPAPAASPSPGAELRGEEIRIGRAPEPIVVDGDLTDPGWRGATRVDVWYETNPGDSIPPSVRNVAFLAYDAKGLVAGFEFEDPEPGKIRAPYADRDHVPSDTDYGGLILDTRNDGRTAILFLANPRGVQYDAVTDDGNETSAPDFFWESAARVTATGWTLEIRVPYTSLRYERAETLTWGILLYRNRPRDYRYQIFSAPMPRDRTCFVCNENVLTGLSGLPPGGAVTAAPYVAARQLTVPREPPGSGLVTEPIDLEAGLDVKWTPSAAVALDATVNPDFSQVESDTAQIATNERFALFYPEKRPFFLEGVDLLSTPVRAVHTRTITSPRWGLRGTGRWGTTSWTAFAGDDRGGGSVVIPGPESSSLAPQDFHSTVAMARARHDVGLSFGSLLVTDREVDGGGYNRVFGPDFQLRLGKSDSIVGQVLWSFSRTPHRPDLAEEWDGRKLSGHGIDAYYVHGTETYDWAAEYKDFSPGFRADLGFVPQVGFREGYAEAGRTWRPTGFFRRVRVFALGDYIADRDGGLLSHVVIAGAGFDGAVDSFGQLQLRDERVRVGEEVLPRRVAQLTLQAVPGGPAGRLTLVVAGGEEVDFDNARPGHGGRVTFSGSVRPTDHLELVASAEVRALDVRPDGGGDETRLFTAHAERLKATYTFTARSFLRAIVEYVGTRRNPALYRDPVPEEDGSFAASLLLAYKLNWQSVVYLGYGDSRSLELENGSDRGLDVRDRQLFLKVSYAFQR